MSIENSLFNGKFLKIKSKEIILPNEKKTVIEFIKHNGAVMIIPILNEKEIILIKQYRPCIDEYLYEFPAGTIETMEEPLDCAKREIIEEIEYSAEKWESLGYVYLAPGYSTEKIHIFKAENLKKNTSFEKDEEEVIEVKIFNKAELKEIYNKGLIKDSKTIVGLSYIGWL
jgi:ADP-ribose pyrophosphatase